GRVQERTLHQARRHLLALAGALARQQRGEDARRHEEDRAHARHRHVQEDRPRSPPRLLPLLARRCLHERVVARPVREAVPGRARDAPREVEDADAVERASHWAVSLAQRRRTCQAGLAAAALPRPPTPIASFASRLRAGEHMAITGAHVLLYTSQPEELRAVL